MDSFTTAIAADDHVDGTLAVTTGRFVVAIAAADPDSTSIGLTLHSFTTAWTATVGLAGTIALAPGRFGVDIEAADPESTSIGLTLHAFSAYIEASSAASATIGTFVGSFTTDIVVFVADQDAVVGSILTAVGPFGITVTAANGDGGVIGLTLDPFDVTVTAETGDVPPSDDITVIDLNLDPFTVTITAETDADESGRIAVTLGSFTFYAEAQTEIDLGEDMTLSEIVPGLLNGLVDGRVWQDATPDDLPRASNGSFLPFIIWTTMGGQDSEYVEQYPAPSHNNARIQIHACAPGGIAVDRLIRRVSNSLLASNYTVGVLGSPVGTYDTDRKLRGRRQQFSIWFRQS